MQDEDEEHEETYEVGTGNVGTATAGRGDRRGEQRPVEAEAGWPSLLLQERGAGPAAV